MMMKTGLVAALVLGALSACSTPEEKEAASKRFQQQRYVGKSAAGNPIYFLTKSSPTALPKPGILKRHTDETARNYPVKDLPPAPKEFGPLFYLLFEELCAGDGYANYRILGSEFSGDFEVRSSSYDRNYYPIYKFKAECLK